MREKIEMNPEYYEEWVPEAGGAYPLLEKKFWFWNNIKYQFTCSLCLFPFADTGQTFYPASTNFLLF